MQVRNSVPLPGLTGLRGVGALWVVAFHAEYGVGLPVAGAGFLGVDMFFILSGFVLSHAHGRTRWGWTEYGTFLQGRFARLFPLHWLVLVLVALVLIRMPQIREEMPHLFGWPELIASSLLVQGWGIGRPASWNVPAWSLSAEWLVSIGFPVFAAVAGRVRRPGLAMAGCLLCLGCFAAFLAITGNPDTDVTARAGVVRAVCEFAAGCLLYQAYAAGLRAGPGMALAGMAAVCAGVLGQGMAVVAVFGFPVLILLAAQPGTRVARALSGQGMLFLGEVSFSVYLLHWVLLQVSNRWQAALDVRGVWAMAWFLGFLAVLLALSTVTFRLVEVPARRRLRGGRRPDVATRPGLAGGTLVPAWPPRDY